MSLLRNERGIEGLPIRLVVALVVGVASLSVMMSTLSGVATLGVTELDVRPTPEVVAPGSTSVTVTVVGPDGDRVAGATVIARGDTARLGNVTTATTGPNGNTTLSLDPGLGPNQPDGTVTFDVKPPAGSGYVDRRGNTDLLVVRDGPTG